MATQRTERVGTLYCNGSNLDQHIHFVKRIEAGMHAGAFSNYDRQVQTILPVKRGNARWCRVLQVNTSVEL